MNRHPRWFVVVPQNLYPSLLVTTVQTQQPQGSSASFIKARVLFARCG
jgi:hypothetical protein